MASDAWELLAEWPGGAVPAIVAGEGGDVLAATAAGLHRSSDGGRSWKWLGLAPDPVTEALIVAAGMESEQAVLLGTGSGVHRSVDGGRTWRPVLVGSRVQCLASTPTSREDGLVLAGTDADGILRSEDGGRNWSGVSAGLLDLNATALALSPNIERDRTAFAGTATGLYRSRNGGRAWRQVELGPEAPAIQAVAVSPAFEDDRLVLAGTEQDGLFRSDDGGQSWGPITGFPEPCVTSLAFGSGDGARQAIAAGTAAGVALSLDGGRTWTLEAPELGPILSIAVIKDGGHAGAGASILAGTVGGGVVRRSLDSDSWTPSNDGLAGRATIHLAASTAYGDVPLLVVSSLDAGVQLSHDAGASWKTGFGGLFSAAATSSALVQIAGGQPSLLAVFGGALHRSEDIEGGWRPVKPHPPVESTWSALSVDSDSSAGTSVVVATGPRAVALSLDAGASWRVIPLPPTDADVVGAYASTGVARDRSLYAVTRATQVTPDGSLQPHGLELWHTDDLGGRWTRWLHSPQATVMSVAVPPAGASDATVLLGHAGRVSRPLRSARELRRGERRPIWQDAPIGEPGSAITAIALSPRFAQDRTMLAADDDQAYISRDGGASFAAWGDDLRVPLITGLTLTLDSDRDGLTAYALGLGGTLWRRSL